MKLFVTGTRGIPDIPGGVEKHCQELYPIIAGLGHDVILATRKSYVVSKKQDEWQGVKLNHIFAPRQKSVEAIVHTFLAVIRARLLHVDILHVHAVGPGLMVPFARLLGLKVVVTNHGPDYDRQKWGLIAKTMLRLGEWLGGCFSHEIIVISKVIEEIIQSRCHRESNLVYNGVKFPNKSSNKNFLDKINVKPKKYLLAVSRFVPEKGLDLLIKCFGQLKNEYKLVIAGDADHETKYSIKLKQLIDDNDKIIQTGYITGDDLNQIYSNARLFVLPSFHEGLPIALLEAMSFGLSVLVSDIPANKEVNLPEKRFFKCGNLSDLKTKIENLLDIELTDIEQQDIKSQIQLKYNWEKIAEQTIEVYNKILK
jgi:alpha-maltose-1-phosphate synthase